MLTWAQKQNKSGYFDFPLRRGAAYARSAMKPINDVHILPYPDGKLPPPKFGLPFKRMPWETPDRGRGFVPPSGGEVSIMPIGAKLKPMKPSVFARQKYGGWGRKPLGGFYGLQGNEIEEAKKQIGEAEKQAQIAKWKQQAIEKTAQQKTEGFKKAWWKPEGQMLKKQAEEAVSRASGAAIEVQQAGAEVQQAKQIYTATKAVAEIDKYIEAANKAQTIPAFQKALNVVATALTEVRKTGDEEVARQLSSQVTEIQNAITEMRAYGMDGLGFSFKKAVQQLTSAGKKAFSPPKVIKKELGKVTKTGLKLMKIALKPSGAKMLAKKGGFKTAISNPNQFIANYNQKLHERNEKKKESEIEQEQGGVQPAEQFEMDGRIYTREEFITAFGMTPEQYEAGYESPTSPVEEQPQPIYLDDPKMPELPYDPVPTPTEPAPSWDYPAEEYYPEEAELIDYAMNPDEWTYEEEPYYEGYDLSYPDEEVIKGTEWYHEKPFGTKRIEEIPLGTEYEETYWRSEAINPSADWYRGMEQYPHTDKDTYIPPYQRGKVSFHDYEEGLGLLFKQRGSRQRYFPEGYRPIRPRPVSPAFARLTKTNKYEPDEITNIPVFVNRNVKLIYNEKIKRNF